jgi:hypothetical protein
VVIVGQGYCGDSRSGVIVGQGYCGDSRAGVTTFNV